MCDVWKNCKEQEVAAAAVNNKVQPLFIYHFDLRALLLAEHQQLPEWL